MTDDIYVKKIHTRFNPQYIAIGNYGHLAILEEEFLSHYDTLAYFFLPFKKGKITASLTAENEKYSCTVTFEGADGLDGCTLQFMGLGQALESLEELIIEQLYEHRSLVVESFPNFYDQEGQLLLFE